MRSILNTNGGKTAFGESQVAQLTQVFNYTSPYNSLNNQLLTFFSGVGGTATSSNGIVSATIGANLGDFSIIQSRRVLHYNAGMGNVVRFTCAFNTPIAGSVQLAGLGNYFNGLFFGYNGLQFGILRKTGGSPHIATLTISSAFSAAASVTITLNSVAFIVTSANASASLPFTASQIVRSLKAQVSVSRNGWQVESIGQVIYFVQFQDGNKNGTYSVNWSTSGGNGTITTAIAGVSATDSWTYQNSFKYDNLLGLGQTKMIIDPTKFNVYQIQLQYLGAGKISMSVEDPDSPNTGFNLVHVIDYPNAYTVPSLENPHMRMFYGVYSTTSTTAMSIKFISFGGFTEGLPFRIDPKYSASSLKTSITTERSLIVLKNKLIYNNRYNTSEIKLLNISTTTDGTKNSTIKLILNPTLCGNTSTDFLNYVNVDSTYSIVAYDVTNATYTGGLVIFSYGAGKADHDLIDLTTQNILISPGDELYITCTSSANVDTQIFISWIEIQ